MKTNKTIKTAMIGIASAITALTLSNCASVQNAGVADYNNDGLVSRAEAAQYHRQKDIEDRNVYTESNKRRNAVNTVRDVRDATWAARNIRNTVRYW